MSDKIDMSLDDIIKKNKTSRGAKRGGGGRGGGRGGARGAGRRSGGGGTPAGKRTPGRGGGARGGRGGRRGGGVGRSPYGGGGRGNSEGSWKHDMYDGPKRGGVLTSGGPGKLVVSNLDFGVSDSDIQELFSEFGHLKTAAVHYDRSGRSLGTADVVFDRKSDAVKAMKQYNGVPLDGRAMDIKMAASASEVTKAITPVRRSPPKRAAPERRKSGGGRVEKPSRGRGRTGAGGRGAKRGGGARGGGRKREPAPSAEELDKELDTYLKAR